MLLSVAVFAWAKYINEELETIHQANAGLDARALAHSGVWVALHPQVTPLTPLLDGTFGPGRGYKVELKGEGGKLNLNWLLQGADQDPRKRLILETYLTRRNLNYEQRAVLIDSMLDWTQPGNLHHLNGAQDSPNYKNAHRPFYNLEEVGLVNGSGPLLAQPDWKSDFTLYSQGPVDLLSASLQVLESIPGIGDARASRFLELRRGPDHLDNTLDDHVFKDITEVRSFLGLSEEQFKALNGLVTIQDPTYHILSEGRSSGVNRKVEVVAQKAGTSPNIIFWKEF
jgi:hypothetical protein